jgi:hypothetical protein
MLTVLIQMVCFQLVLSTLVLKTRDITLSGKTMMWSLFKIAPIFPMSLFIQIKDSYIITKTPVKKKEWLYAYKNIENYK